MKKFLIVLVLAVLALALLNCTKNMPSEPAAPTGTQTPTVTCTATVTPCFAFGNLEASGGACLGYCDRTYFQRFYLAAGTTITKIYVDMEYAGGITAAIYADSSGCPGARIVYNSAPYASAVGWNIVDVPDTAISAGYYWLAINASDIYAQVHTVTKTYPDYVYADTGIGMPADLSGICPSGYTMNYILTMFASCEP